MDVTYWSHLYYIVCISSKLQLELQLPPPTVARCIAETKVSFALDKNCYVCAKWMLHSIRPVAIPAWNRNNNEENPATVECSNHFAHTQQFLSNAKLTLILTMNGFECRTMRQATKLSDWQWALGIFLLSMSRPRVSQNFLGEGWLFPEVVKVCPLKFLPTQISNQFWALLFGMRKCGMKEAKMDD